VQRFRADVEGLRAVAVVAVVAYHAGVPWLSGGFVGVDVFFVLSGFLITGLLWRELSAHGRVSFREFYARRARRLLPAAVVVLAFTLVASVVAFSALRAADVGRDAAAAAAYVANYRFAYVRTDYLASTAPSPLLHYWSLGVEEQFYVVWPLLLLLAFRIRRVPLVLAVVAVASFGGAVWLTDRSQPWAFFSLPTRAWELAVGGLVALAVPSLRRLDRRLAVALGWGGLAAICWAAVAYGASTPFPGVAALAPVLGTAAVVAAGCTNPRYGVQRLLGRRGPRAVGRVSYSWYLWHFPLLVLLPGPPALLVAFGSLLPAVATLRLVENPVRFSARLRARPGRSVAGGLVLTAAATAGALLVVVALPTPRGTGNAAAAPALSASPAPRADPATPAPTVAETLQATVTEAIAAGLLTRAVPARLDPSLAHARADKPEVYDRGCHAAYDVTSPAPCVFGDAASKTRVFLYGDSHAAMWFPAIEAAHPDWRIEPMTKSACPPVTLEVFSPVFGRTYRECAAYRDAVVERVRAERPALVVIGSARHYEPVYRFTVYGQEWVDGLATTVRRMREAGAAVVVLGPVPRPKGDVPDCLARHLSDARACTQPRSAAVNEAGIAAERAAVEAAGGTYLDVTDWVCNQTCPAVVGTMLVYRDDNHLSTVYPAWLAPLVKARLDEVLGR
jgi:peptidoglycan/LPS O-acetylase OafA/YrhL